VLARLQPRLTFANVMSMIAVFIALGAGAYAAGLKKNSVKSKQIASGAVKTAELADGAVTSPKVADGAITGAKADEASFGIVPDAAALGGLPPGTFERSNRVMYGFSGNANGITTEIFSWPDMGLRVRGDGDVDSSDLGVTIENTGGAGLINVLFDVGGGGGTAATNFPYELPNAEENVILVSENDPTKAVLLRCLSQDAVGIPSRAYCWGIRSKP
jgi:hypothetical protein